ncbi:hypothetical protein GG344DRAFT_91526 [Lentinula edodes]|nr:hypothetical protein GG344DRAFT_91526 [Lentinula edodes]
MIARCRAKKDGMPNTPILQRALKGNIIIYPQRPSAIAKILPPDLNDIASAICVIFIGSTRPTDEWLKTKAKPLAVRPAIVRSNLEWLKIHNILYHDVQIDYELLNSLPLSYTLPVHVEYLELSDIDDCLTSGYAPSISKPSSDNLCSSGELSFDSVVIADVDAAAIRHIKGKGGAYVEIPHDSLPVNEFMNPTLFPMIYPTLFP